MKKKILYLISLIIFLAIVTIVFSVSRTKRNDPYADLKCPDDYDNREEQMIGFNKFLDRYLDKNPAASGQDIQNERLMFFEKHNCVAGLERYRLSQTGQKSSVPEVREAVTKSFEERGFRILEE